MRLRDAMGRTWLIAVLALVLAACGGGDSDGGGEATSDPVGDRASDSSDSESGAADVGTGNGGSSSAMATLTVGDEVYTWTADQMVICEVNGVFGPANAEFREAPRGQDGNWVQFIDRGDGGVNFSAVLGGEEHVGTGPGEADDLSPAGWTFTGEMSRSNEPVDVELEVTC